MNELVALRRPGVRLVHKGRVAVGGAAPVSIQSMTTTVTEDVDATESQIRRLAAAGCQIVRVAVPSPRAARALSELKLRSPLPLVADVHFDHRLALAAIEAGVDGLRLNPGNIGADNVPAVARAAAAAGIPIRVGVNGGSLEKDIERRHGGATAEALVESALRHVDLLESAGFHDILISLKSSSVQTTLEAYRLAARMRPYPLHVGVTEAGLGPEGRAKSFLGVGLLLLEGIGETIRISLTGDPVAEISAALDLLATASRMATRLAAVTS